MALVHSFKMLAAETQGEVWLKTGNLTSCIGW